MYKKDNSWLTTVSYMYSARNINNKVACVIMQNVNMIMPYSPISCRSLQTCKRSQRAWLHITKKTKNKTKKGETFSFLYFLVQSFPNFLEKHGEKKFLKRKTKRTHIWKHKEILVKFIFLLIKEPTLLLASCKVFVQNMFVVKWALHMNLLRLEVRFLHCNLWSCSWIYVYLKFWFY